MIGRAIWKAIPCGRSWTQSFAREQSTAGQFFYPRFSLRLGLAVTSNNVLPREFGLIEALARSLARATQ
jgi:hypothetical protein